MGGVGLCRFTGPCSVLLNATPLRYIENGCVLNILLLKPNFTPFVGHVSVVNAVAI